MRITKETIDLLINGSRDERVYACAKSFTLFKVYYFTKYFTYKPAPFHEDFDQDIEDLVYGRLKEAAWIAHRDSAKTSHAKMALAWIIARQTVIDRLRKAGENVGHWGEHHYLNVDAYDKENAEARLFDVVTELQTNSRLIADFGHLYNQPRTKDAVQVKRISNFVTTNKIRVEAHTAMTPVRGRLHENYRPDFILRDDLENEITADSPKMTEKIVRNLDEAQGGMADYGSALNLGNFVIENGTIGYIKRKLEASGGRVRFIPVVDKLGTISWPAKYVKTDAEATAANKGIDDPTQRKVSLESKKREMNGGGRRVYEVDMLLDPVAAGSPYFDRTIIERLLDQCAEKKEDKANFWLWGTYDPSHRYAIGADVGKGNGNDHSASCLIDFSTNPNRQVGSYANNEIPADQFAYELKREADMFGTCLIAPEKNAEAGGSCLTSLKMIYPADMIYRQVPLDRQTDKPVGTGELGWETTGATKYTILDALRAAVQSGQLLIQDERILKEMKVFTHSDADDLGRTRQGLYTNHFDLLMATAITWEMRKRARVKETASDTYSQPEYEQPSLNG